MINNRPQAYQEWLTVVAKKISQAKLHQILTSVGRGLLNWVSSRRLSPPNAPHHI